MERQNNKAILMYLVTLTKEYLQELSEIKSDSKNQFAYGEKTAYAEILEIIKSLWEDAEKNGLDFEIEKVFPLD